MRFYLGMAVILLALLIATSGIAAISRGWVLPMNRSLVRRPRLYGWGQLVVAVALCFQVVFVLMTDGLGIRQWGTLTGSVVMLTGVLLMGAGQRTAGRRKRGYAP